MTKSSPIDVAIIGAGLAGLTAALVLKESGIRAQIFEANSRVGGRIYSIRDQLSGSPVADLGPTWIWPPYQAAASKWVEKLALTVFQQYETGYAVIDMDPNRPPHQQFLPGQHGMARIAGGPQAMVDAIASKLAPDQVILNHTLHDITPADSGITLRFDEPSIGPVEARRIIFAAPLRALAEQVRWNGSLPPALLNAMTATPTWMSAQAKVVISYDTAFWKLKELSGRVASQIGPLVEIHDHTSHDDKQPALFGFVGLPFEQRRTADLKKDIVEQLTRCFGPNAAQYQQIVIQDWAQENLICSQKDLASPAVHPSAPPPVLTGGVWDDRAAFAVAETGTLHPGLIDGALEAGERAARFMARQLA